MKVKVIKINFDKKAKEALEKRGGLFGMLSEVAGVDFANLPEEQEIWIDTKWIAQIDTPLPEEFSQGSFMVHFAFGGKDDMAKVTIKNTCYDELLEAWKAE